MVVSMEGRHIDSQKDRNSVDEASNATIIEMKTTNSSTR
jgi:hypothetical protein